MASGRQPERLPGWAVRGGPVAILAAALALRLWRLGARSLWTDEGSTWTAATSPLPELIRLCAQKDASPPLFYLLISGVTRLGDSEAHLRFISMVASVGLVWLTYRLVRLFAGRSQGLLAAAIVTVSPFQVMFAQEARTYSLVACLTVWSLYLFARAALLGRRRAWLPYVAVSTLAIYTQSIAALGVGVQGALLILSRAGRERILPWLSSQVAVAALYLPWLFVSLAQMSRLGQSHWYLEPPGVHTTFQVVRALFLSPIPLVTPPPGAALPGIDAWLPPPVAHLVLAAIPGLPFLAAVRGALGGGVAGSTTRALLIAFFLPLVAVFTVSLFSPLWLPRYFVFLSPFLAALLARGVFCLRPPALARTWGALILVSGSYACFRYDRDYTKEPWREVVEEIGRQGRAARTAVLVPFDVDPFRYYNQRLERPVAAFEVSHPEVPFASRYTEEQIGEIESRAAALAAGYDDVWVVVRSPNSEVRREIARRSERVAAEGRTQVERRQWNSVGGPLSVSRYVRIAPAAADPIGASKDRRE